MSDTFQLDPAPEEWLSTSRICKLRSELGDAVSLLSEAGVLRSVLIYWIRRELGETEDNPSASISWARSHWEHRLDSLFLQRKDYLDQASCSILRVKEQGLALELYHRLLAQEASFEELSMKFSVGPERFHGGLLKQQSLSNLPGNFGRFLRKLEPGELTKPLKLGEQFVIIQLKSFAPAVYGEASKLQLLELELKFWLDGMTAHLEALVDL
jgi:parvulin-like peptidyl-prolyl isomerase